MIWYLIGYVLMGIWGSDFIVGVILGIKLMMNGYYMDFDDISHYVIRLGLDRSDNSVFGKMANKSNVVAVIWVAFQVMTWPVQFLRTIFLDIPDAIEFYETQQNKGEQA